jgi:hypothetical protein
MGFGRHGMQVARAATSEVGAVARGIAHTTRQSRPPHSASATIRASSASEPASILVMTEAR